MDQRIVGRQQWRDLLFLHQPVAADLLRRLVPASLAIDTFEGQAWVSLIPFAIRGSRPKGLPGALAMNFLETNLRTYVRGPDGVAGVFFFSLEASSWLAVAGARAAYALPYFPARMACRRQDGTVHYRSHRVLGGEAELETTWTVGASRGVAAPATLDHFLVERYALFAARGARVLQARVHHRPYPLCQATVSSLRETLLARAGLPPLSSPPAAIHFSPGVDVDIGWRHPV
jgi:uncharacterized protein YqjF (DUF2071 family)